MARKISVFAGQVEEQDQKNKLVELTEMFLLRRPGCPHGKKQPEQPLPSLGRRGNRGHPVDRRRRSSPPRRDHVRVQVSDADVITFDVLKVFLCFIVLQLDTLIIY